MNRQTTRGPGRWLGRLTARLTVRCCGRTARPWRQDLGGPGARPMRHVRRSLAAITPALCGQSGSAGRAIDPGREHYFPPVWVLVGNAAVVLPVVDLRNRVDARSGQPCRYALAGPSIGQVEHQLIKP